MIRVALVDDHITVREGIKRLIESINDIVVVIEASNGKELLDQMSSDHIPDIVVLDIYMPVINGFQTTKLLSEKYPTVKVIAFSLINEEDAIIHIIGLGARSYVTKNDDPVALISAIVSVYEKGECLNEHVKKDYFLKRTVAKKRGFVGKTFLSKKEVDFIKLAATEMSYKEIAAVLKISPKTVENYRDSIFYKLNIKSRAVLVLYAYKNGLLA